MPRAFSTDSRWLFGRTADWLAFGGSAALSLFLLALGATQGWLDADVPLWVFVTCILAVDVAHVWSTGYRVYLDGEEVKRRPWLYLGTPAACYGLGVAVHLRSSAIFWTLLAYAAVFHFVRQQYGWVMLYRRRAGERGRLDYWIDAVTVYTASVYPLLHWHTHLPKRFSWFMPGDFISVTAVQQGLLATWVSQLEPVYYAIGIAFVARQVVRSLRGDPVNSGKVLVITTTWLCWWLGIMAFNSDYAFTVTNVLIHGIPYMFLTYRYGRAQAELSPQKPIARVLRFGVVAFLVSCIAIAFIEETLWDRLSLV